MSASQQMLLASVSAGVASPVYDPSKGATYNTFSNGNRSVAGNDASNIGIARSLVGYNSGKRYAEIALTTQGVGFSLGLIKSSFAGSYNNNQVGFTPSSTSIGIDSGAQDIVINSTPTGSYTIVLASGDVIQVALDLTANKVWFGKNGNWIDGSPATPTGGETITAGTWYLATNQYYTTTLVTLMAPSFALPSSYTAW